MASQISNSASPLPPQVERVPSTALVDTAAGVVEERQALAARGNAAVASAGPADQSEESPVSAQELEQATRDISSYMQSVSRSLEISVDAELGTTIIQVLDTETDEIVRQIPAEETLRFARILAERQSEAMDGQSTLGLLLDSEG